VNRSQPTCQVFSMSELLNLPKPPDYYIRDRHEVWLQDYNNLAIVWTNWKPWRIKFASEADAIMVAEVLAHREPDRAIQIISALSHEEVLDES